MRPIRPSFWLVVALCCVVLPAFAQNPPASSLAQGREALTDRRYDDAIRLLTVAAQGQDKADEARLLLGHAFFYAKKYPEAIAAYDRLLRDYPQSLWRKKALFRKADAHAALKQYDLAAAIYEPEMDYIVSDQRKEQVAETYLKYANQYFEPPKNAKGETPAPNYAKAKSLFQKALDIGLTPKKTEEVLFRVALSDFRTDNFEGALATLQQLLRQFPKGALIEQVKQHIGLSHLRAGNDREARKVFRDFLRDYPKSTLGGDVSYALAETYHVPAPRDNKELELGVLALHTFATAFPAHPKALQAQYFIGLSYFNRQRYEDAVKEFQAFIEKHGRSTADEVALAKNNLGFAYLRQKKYALATATWEQFLREYPVHRLWNDVQRQVIDAHYQIGEDAYKAKKYDAAVVAWQAFQEKYPLDVRNADIMFRLGMMLHDDKKYDAAVEQWERVVSKYADTEAASRAQFMIAMTYEKLDKFEPAMVAFRAVKGKWQSEAERRLQTLKERKLVVYTERTFTSADTPALKLITRNIQRLDFRAYKVDMSDYFRKLHTMRGVEKLDLNLIEPDQRWDLALPGYQEFKEHETAAPLPFKEPGVYAVVCSAQPDAEEVQRLRDAGQEPPVLEAINIVLITDLGIISKTTHNDVFVFAENLKTRQPWPGASVLVSDGRKIIGTGTTDKDGVFHYRGQGSGDRGQGLGARVQGIAELQTLNPIPQTLLPEVRVLTFNSGHYASTEGDLRSVARASGLQPTAHLYSDRPLYRPGQPVHLRGIVRGVENGVYTFHKGEEYILTVTDASGGVVRTRRVQLGDFGTFSDSLVLSGEAPVGRYTIMLTKPKPKAESERGGVGEWENGRAGEISLSPPPPRSATPPFSATGYFQVATYRIDKVRLAIELPKTVYLRGEEIKGKVVAKYYYGEPLAKRKVRFGWNNAVGEERETNEKGEFEFTIPTRQFEEDETLSLWARLEEEGAQTRLAAYVAVVGVRASLSTLRDLHLVGEKFDVSVAATDLAGKAFTGDFTLKVLKHEKDAADRLAEREIQSLAVKTDDKGKATVSLSLPESGEYALRLTGQDANGNPLTSELETRVVGDEDEVRLRVLTDTDTYKLGDTAGVRVIWRGRSVGSKQEAGGSQQDAAGSPANRDREAVEPDQLALVTYEGERIYGYQLVTLKKGDNAIRVPLTASLAPTFRFSIALMDGDQFHLATKWFSVEHELRVKIKTERVATSPDPSLVRRGTAGQTPLPGKDGPGEVYRPGDKVRATIETTDQNGKPVAAELSLAVVDEALLAAAGGTGPSVLALLQTRNAMDNAILTDTSATFNYAGEAKQRVLQVKEAAGIQQVMLAGVGEGADVPRGHWAYNALNMLSQAGIVEGLPDGTVAGNKPMTRYEMAVNVARLLESVPLGDVGPQGAAGPQGGANRAIPAQQTERGSRRAGGDLNRNQANELVTALRREYAPELERLGVRVDALENRVTNLAGVNKPSRSVTSVGVLHRSGTANDLVRRGDLPDFNTFARKSDISGVAATDGAHGWGGGDARESKPGDRFARDMDAIVAVDPQNALLVYNPAGERSLRQLVADRNLSEKDFQQLVNTLRNRFAETAFWNASIVTDKEGKATTEFTLPDSLTEWRLTSRGVTTDTLVGEGSDKITSSKSFLVELKTPAVLQQGDRVAVTAVLHNNSDKAIKARVMLHPQFDGQAGRNQPQNVSLEPNSAHEVTFALDVPDARSGTFKLEATTDQPGLSDSLEQTVPVQPWGIEHVVSEGGEAQGDRVVEIKLPDAKYLSRRLSITVGPSVAASLIDIAANPGGYGWRQPLTASTAHRALSILHALGYMRSLNRADEPLFRRLSGELESHLARLVQAQNKDGGWSWALPTPPAVNKGNQERAGRTSDDTTTADAVSALALAKQLGFAVPGKTMTTALTFLQGRFQAVGEGDNTTKAVILHAQSVAGAADFAYVNRLYRLRNALDARSLALLVLTLSNMNRDPMALEVARLLEERIPPFKTSPGPSLVRRGVESAEVRPSSALNLRSLEDVAIVTLALATAEPNNALLDDLARLLWARRTGNSWQTPRSTAWALAALIQQARTARTAPEKYTLGISVRDKEIKRLAVDGDATTATVEVPAELLAGANAKVSFDMEGKGTFIYSCVLTGFTDQGMVDAETREKQDKEGTGPASGPLIIRRTYTQAPRIWDGKPVPSGFSSIASGETWQNLSREVPIGKHVHVQLTWWTPNDTDIGENMGNYIVVREPLPAGCRVLEESITGDFERYEIGEGEITFFFYSLRDPGASYDLYGALDGDYRILPTKVWAFDRPDLYAYGTTKNLRVLPRHETSKDVYRLTPDELLFLGKAHFERVQDAVANERPVNEADLKDAERYLTELFDKDADPKGWKLREDPARDTAQMLFSLSLRHNDAPKTVRFFEVLRERYPTVVIPFKEIVQTAKAYGGLGEREREVQVLRATAEASFTREAKVAGALEEEGEHLASYTYLANRAQEYPDVANVESSLYALAQTVAQRAEQVRNGGSKEQARALAKLAAETLRDFLAVYAENPVGDEASFAYAVNLVEQERFAEAAAWSARSIERYPKSLFLDDYAYIATYASYLGEKFDNALAMAKTLATTEYLQEDGSKAPSAYRAFALYIAAQIFHARGNAGEAVQFYQQVAQQFPDAREAAEYFLTRNLKIPEVVAVGPKDPVRLKIRARNVKAAQVSVYRVDLLKFYQNRRNLLDLATMNLAGIKPMWEGEVDLGDGEFVDKDKTIDLPLQEKGAYFVTVKATDGETRLQASGVVVRTNLELEVQEDQVSGRVRVNVVNKAGGGVQPKAEVWVVGSENDAFRKGTTDLRGLVFVDDVRGRPTVIAYKEGDYAFYRGDKILQPQLAKGAPAVANQPASAAGAANFKEQARNAYIGNNSRIQEQQSNVLKGVMKGGMGGSGRDGFGGGGVAAGQAF